MDIRTKLVFTLVCVSLASMLLLGVVTYRAVEGELRTQTLEQLDGLADSKSEAVGSVVDGWHDRVSLVASRTQLRVSMDQTTRSGGMGEAPRIERILQDAVAAVPLILRLSVHDASGRFVAEAGEVAEAVAHVDPDAEARPIELRNDRTTRYTGLVFVPDGAPIVRFVADLLWEGASVGTLSAWLSTEEIEALATNLRGLGETGETVIVVSADGESRVLHPLRFSENARAGAIVDRDATVRRALDRVEEPRADQVRDYRGQSVWAATRFVDEVEWGVVVKVDAEEQATPIRDFRNDMIRLAISLAAFSILFGTILGFRFAQPIHILADTASRIGAGDLSARSGVKSEDEVGLLGRTIDGMAADLEEQVGLLTEFRRFFDVSIDMLCIASTDGFFKRVNPAFVRELGWPEEELLQKPFVSLVHPDDVDATLAEVQKLATGVPTISFENRFLRADGSYLALRWNSYPEEETGRLYAIARVSTTMAD